MHPHVSKTVRNAQRILTSLHPTFLYVTYFCRSLIISFLFCINPRNTWSPITIVGTAIRPCFLTSSSLFFSSAMLLLSTSTSFCAKKLFATRQSPHVSEENITTFFFPCPDKPINFISLLYLFVVISWTCRIIYPACIFTVTRHY